MENKGPEFLRFIIPIINVLKQNHNSGKAKDITTKVIQLCQIPDEELNIKLKWGENRIKNQIHWARFYLFKTDYLDASQKGIWKLTEKGISSNLTFDDVYEIFKNVQKSINENTFDDEEDETNLEIEEDNKSIEIFYQDFFNNIKLDHYLNHTPIYLGDPNRIKINEIIKKCSDTKWVIPHFQRYFDWTKTDIKELLESIFYEYYVGSFLLWESNKSPEIGIQPILGINEEIDNLKPSEIILDGQQRITALYYAITSPNISIKGSKTKLFYYINFQKFLSSIEKVDIVEIHTQKISKELSFHRMLFPIYELDKYSTWIYDFEDFLISNNIENDKVRNIRRIIEEKLRYIWSGFEIPYISLPEKLNLSQVTDIFEKINTKGKQLNVFDLLIARLYNYDIELKNLWDETLSSYSIIKKYFIDGKIDKMPIYLLQSISLYYSKSSTSQRSDILDIYNLIYKNNKDTEKNFIEDWEDMSLYMGLALEKIENMRDGFGVRSEKDLPYAPMIPVLTALLKLIDNCENKSDCNKKIKIWYWSAVFTTAYSSAADSQMTTDYKELKNWFNNDNDIPKVVTAFKREIFNLNLFDVQSTSNAKYKGVLSLIALKGAKDFDTNLTLENSKKNDKDHLFPKSMDNINKKYINSVLNMTWMSEDTNRKIKKYKKPSKYIIEFIKDKYNNSEKKFLNLTDSHLINNEAYNFMKIDDFDNFLDKRQFEIKNFLLEITETLAEKNTNDILISENTPFSNKIGMLSTLRQCNSYIYWLDKYFSLKGLEFIIQVINDIKINELKILMSIDKTDENFRKFFKDFKNELNEKKVNSELRIITNSKIKSSIHDRFIISNNISFNIPSPDIIARNQLSEIKMTENTDNLKNVFEDIWKNSLDIINDWNKISSFIEEFNKKKF